MTAFVIVASIFAVTSYWSSWHRSLRRTLQQLIHYSAIARDCEKRSSLNIIIKKLFESLNNPAPAAS